MAVEPMSMPHSPGWNPQAAPGVPASAPPSILLTHGWALGAPSGVARHVKELARALAERGSRVTVLCISTAGYSGFPRPALPAALEGREIEQELAEHRVVVVVFHTPGSDLDGEGLREARAGAASANAGFVAVDVTKENAVATIAAEYEVLGSPTVLVVVKSGEARSRFEGYVDRETVAQAVTNALK